MPKKCSRIGFIQVEQNKEKCSICVEDVAAQLGRSKKEISLKGTLILKIKIWCCNYIVFVLSPSGVKTPKKKEKKGKYLSGPSIKTSEWHLAKDETCLFFDVFKGGGRHNRETDKEDVCLGVTQRS